LTLTLHRGIAETCRRADITDTVKQRPRKSISPGLQSPDQSGSFRELLLNERLLSLVTSLSDRVQRLEAKVDGAQTPIQFNSANLDPSLSQDLRSSSQLERPAKRARIQPDETVHLPTLNKNDQIAEDDSAEQNDSDAEVEDAATVLEFLAWGRLKDSNLTNGIREPNLHDSAVRPDADVIQGVQAWGSSPSSVPGGGAVLETLSVSQIQDLLLTKMQVFLLFEYHSDWLLFMHCAFHVPTFRKGLDRFYDDDQGVINMTSTGLQWASLLFAIMCGSMACARPRSIQKWGFKEEEQGVLARKWYQASIECLNAARYQQYHIIYSIQTIACSTFCAHILGFSNSQSVMLASAVRIAQSLGLHRLSSPRRRGQQPDITADVAQKELGRRLWQQLVTQDWFSVPFSETYCINPLHFSSEPPMHCDEETMQAIPRFQPSITTYGSFLFRVASLVPTLQDRSSEAHTLQLKYEQVLIFDKMMRELVVTQLPSCLNSQTQIDPLWPSWVAVARRCLTITSAHKIIMIHRRFLGMSFRDQRYSFTRRTCLAAAKTIINEIKEDVQDENPILWTDQAFTVAASIILTLDNFNCQQSAREYEEHRRLVKDAIAVLAQSVAISSIAARGTRLLSDLLVEQEKHTRNLNNTTARRESNNDLSVSDIATEKSLNVAAFVKKFCENDPPTSGGSPIATSHMPLWLQQENSIQSYERSQGHMLSLEMFDPLSIRSTFSSSQATAQQHSYGTLDPPNGHQGPGIPPFSQHMPDSFDIRSLNWLDDLMGLAPSNSI
jgi:hypothetical protein